MDGLDAAIESQADAVLLTLADASRPIADLRKEVAAASVRAGEAGKAVLVVVNHPRTKMLRDDIDVVLNRHIKGMLLPHAVEAQDGRDLAVLLREFELKRDIEPGDTTVYPMIDSARGLLRADAIASAAPRIGGLVFHPRRYAHDAGARDEQRGDRLAYARGQVVAVSRAYGHAPMTFSDGLELTYLAECGFASAILPDPRYVANANSVFAPSEGARELARQSIEAYDAARAESAYVARVGEMVIDGPAAHKARHTLEE
jgi:citrate lyase subunit beta / citryl-CoA lyase